MLARLITVILRTGWCSLPHLATRMLSAAPYIVAFGPRVLAQEIQPNKLLNCPPPDVKLRFREGGYPREGCGSTAGQLELLSGPPRGSNLLSSKGCES